MTSEREKMTDERLKEIQERLDKATPGKCRCGDFDLPTPESNVNDRHIRTHTARACGVCDQHARKDIPFLLAEIERLKGMIGRAIDRGNKCDMLDECILDIQEILEGDGE